MITGADAVVVQYYIANLHTSCVTDIQADRQTGRRHACKWITNEQMVTLALCECGKVAFHLIRNVTDIQTDGQVDGQTDVMAYSQPVIRWLAKNRLSYITR